MIQPSVSPKKYTYIDANMQHNCPAHDRRILFFKMVVLANGHVNIKSQYFPLVEGHLGTYKLEPY